MAAISASVMPGTEHREQAGDQQHPDGLVELQEAARTSAPLLRADRDAHDRDGQEPELSTMALAAANTPQGQGQAERRHETVGDR